SVPATPRTDRSSAGRRRAAVPRAGSRWTGARPWRLLRRRWWRSFETAAERKMQVDALRELFGAHREQRDARIGGGHALLLERAAIGAADAQAGLGERERAILFVKGLAQ